MNLLNKYGRQAAITCIALGLISLISAIFFFSTPFTAILWVAGEDQPVEFPADNAIAANWLLNAGIRLFPGDSLYYSGIEIAPSFAMPEIDQQILLYKPAFPITLSINGMVERYYSSAPTLGAALWEQGIGILSGDKISLLLDKPLSEPLSVSIQHGQVVSIKAGDQTLDVTTAAETVGEALADAGISLQNLDFSTPVEDKPIPNDRIIKVTRVSEETILDEKVIPFTKERVPDAELNAGQEKVLQSGQNGVKTSSFCVRYENGKEVERTVEAEWVSKQPISQKTAYGTTVVVQTYDSPDGSVDYWLSKQVYISSYHDTGSPTASGIWPYYGVIAVAPNWYSILKGTSIYVPGYGVGTVLDVCPGCAGKPWIDVFIPTSDYVSWNKNETVYFLPPAPAGFSGDLP
ncbi:MAG: G5 domain-containing protein [Pelolinea sp.]|nr:G5 domain-containing protein [Pelolinea sp.]